MVNEQELMKAFEDKEFAERVFKLETKEEVQKALKEEKNIDISYEELEQLQSAVIEITKQLKNGEITEEELANVSGGASAGNVAKKIAIGAAKVTSAAAVIAIALAGGYMAGFVYGKDENNPEYLESTKPGQILRDAKKEGKRAVEDTKREIKRLWG